MLLIALAAFIQLFVTFGGAQSCTENDVRLVGGSGNWEGNVQVCYKGKWGHVCDNQWNLADAQVVCKQLKFSTTGVEYRSYSYYGYSTANHVLDYVQCSGSESKLTDCSSTVELGAANCGIAEMAGVYCGYGGSCTHGDIRLANNYISSYGRGEGRIEVCNGGSWATICAYPSYTWTSPDARVACRQLGFTSSLVNPYYYGGGVYGYGIVNSAFSYMGCSGSETSLFSCSKTSSSYCISHYYDAGARCYSTESGCTNGDVRLFSAFDGTPDNEGVLQICTAGTWYSICQYYYSCYIAKTACVQMGYSGALGLRYNGGFYYGYSQYNDPYRYYCYSSGLNNIGNCYKYYYYACGAYNDALGLICYDGGDGANECTDGDVRLVNGSTANEGRVEYCYSTTWAPVCYLNSYAATLMCQKLGYTQFTWGKVINDERFGRSGKESPLNYVYCNSNHAQLSDCVLNIKGGGCYISSSTCGTEYSLRCYNPGTCTDGKVRLADGMIEQEGRPEICVNGVWGTFCQWSWNAIDAFVFCNMLGHDGPNPTLYYNSYFGDGYGPVAYSSVFCNGWEGDIHDCTKTSYPSFNCPNTAIAGVVCKQGCTDGDVRLVGSGYDNEGTIEVCFSNLWGLIADHGWNEADAKVVCKQLGHKDGIFKPIVGSQYGKPNKTIHLKDVACVGDEDDLSQCTKTQVYLTAGKKMLNTAEVAGVDCIFDEPTPPPCIENPSIDPSDSCSPDGSFRLMKNGVDNKDEGRVEYCMNGFWSPLCSMDGQTAAAACKYLEHTQYYYGAVIETGEYGMLLNYSLIQNITCTASSNSLSDCTVYEPVDSCLPWCPDANIGLKCFDSGICKEGSVRLVDAIIEQEGRVEVCVNGVWGSICDDGWDKTDAHVVCTQLGHPELEPVVYSGSYFGDGGYPIVYSNMGCGGWEDGIADCDKTVYADFTCPRSKVAGVLCGYDCEDGDVRLVGSDYRYEGIVEICFNNLWGLIEDVGWTELDAQVACRQLGYQVEGTIASFTKDSMTPNKTVHSSNMQCTGNEERISECTQTTFSLHEGKSKRTTNGLKVAGATCFTPDRCVPPPANSGTDCTSGDLRLSGDNAVNGEGTIEYCYKGRWSGMCSLKEKEAVVACRQLGYTDFSTVSIFSDGRFDSAVSNSSLFTNFSCGIEGEQLMLSECDIIDSCRLNCSYPIGITCSAKANCEEGDVRLRGGSIAQEGRVEVCHDNVWGSICGKGFDFTDAYVVCKELDLGVSEPVVYTNSYFGDGNVPIVYSNMSCRGYENTVVDCTKDVFGSFSCFRNNTASVVCQNNCTMGDVRLVGSSSKSKGTLEVCYFSSWGLISTANWTKEDTAVACRNLGYDSGDGFTDSRFGKPNVGVHLSQVMCNGTESKLSDCDANLLNPDEGKDLTDNVDVVGVSCTTQAAKEEESSQARQTSGLQAGIGIIAALFVMSILIVISLVVYVLVLKQGRKANLDNTRSGPVTMSSLQDSRSVGVTNPAAAIDDDGLGEDDQSILEKTDMYVNY